jgi:putative transposase
LSELATMIRTTGRHLPKSIIFMAVRWYLAYKLSYRDIEELLAERGVIVDHSTIARWVLQYAPLLLGQFRKRQRRVGTSWRMDETYIPVRGKWMYEYRAVDKSGQTIDFYFSPHRDEVSARRFLTRAIMAHGCPKKVTIDGSQANRAAIEHINEERRAIHGKPIEIRQCQYLNNIVEQDHRGIKGRIRAMLGFKSVVTAAATLAGIELIHMLRKRQLCERFQRPSLAQSIELLTA